MQKVTAGVEYQGVEVDITIEINVNGDERVRNEALDRMHSVILREAQRFAEIAVVDIRDQPIDAEEARRIAGLDPNRPHIIVPTGTKDPAQSLVVQGSYELGDDETDHKRRTVKAGNGQPAPRKGSR